MANIGGVEVQRVIEWLGPMKTVDEMFPDTPAESWTDDLAPHYWVPGDPRLPRGHPDLGAAVRRPHCADRHWRGQRPRPAASSVPGPPSTDFLASPADAGVRPEDVDVVVNTHIHYDHVGWNTRLDGGRWVPTFPNARYLVPEADYEYFRPENAERMRSPRTEDKRHGSRGSAWSSPTASRRSRPRGSCRPGAGSYQVDARLRLEPAPEHTPGSSVAWLGDQNGAVFVGDLVHHPDPAPAPLGLVRVRPRCRCSQAQPGAVPTAAARASATVLPAHFAGQGAVNLTIGDDDEPTLGLVGEFPELISRGCGRLG